MTPLYKTIRALRDALVEVRSSPVLPAAQADHVSAAIHHVAAVLANSDADHPLTCMDSSDDDGQQNSRRTRKTEHVDTNTPMGVRSLRDDMAEMRSKKPKPLPATAEQIAWSLLRLKKS
jgi:hypothetical protein